MNPTLKRILVALAWLVFVSAVLVWTFTASVGTRTRKNYTMDEKEFDGAALEKQPVQTEYDIQPQGADVVRFMRGVTLPDNVYWVVNRIGEGAGERTVCSYRKSGEDSRADSYIGGVLQSYCIRTQDKIIKYSIEDHIKEILPLEEGFDPVDYIYMDCFSELKSIDPENIISAEFSVTSGERTLTVEYNAKNGVLRRCVISLTKGIPLRCEDYENGVLTGYSATVTYTVEKADPALFR